MRILCYNMSAWVNNYIPRGMVVRPGPARFGAIQAVKHASQGRKPSAGVLLAVGGRAERSYGGTSSGLDLVGPLSVTVKATPYV